MDNIFSARLFFTSTTGILQEREELRGKVEHLDLTLTQQSNLLDETQAANSSLEAKLSSVEQKLADLSNENETFVSNIRAVLLFLYKRSG